MSKKSSSAGQDIEYSHGLAMDWDDSKEASLAILSLIYFAEQLRLTVAERHQIGAKDFLIGIITALVASSR